MLRPGGDTAAPLPTFEQPSVLESLGLAAPKAVTAPPSESSTLFGDAKAETVAGELGAGLQRGVRQVASTPIALGGLMADAIGASETGASWVEWSRQIAEGGAKRGVARLEDLSSDPISWARYVAGVTGEAVPFILSVLGGAGAGSVLARLLAKKGVSQAERALIMATAQHTGATYGAFGTSAAVETGATAQELFDATKTVRPFASVAAGSAKGALEMAFPLVLSRQFGMPLGEATGFYNQLIDRIAKSEGTRAGRIAVGFGTEALTELAQEEVDIQARSYFDTNYSPISYDAWSRRANAFVAGGVGGGVFSAMTPSHAQTALDENAVRTASDTLPGIYGAEADEIPVAPPSHILKTATSGLDVTAGVASGELLDQTLDTVDLRRRGLFAAVTPGRDLTFGTQDQANNDYDYYQGTGFLRLDPARVKRGEVTASVEDLPSSVNDSRVNFGDTSTLKQATDALGAAVATVAQAKKARGELEQEQLMVQAERQYRAALNLGARVEPLVDGQVVLRSASRAAELVQEVATVTPQVSTAKVAETRIRPGGQEFYVLSAEAPADGVAPSGKVVDLENIDPDDVTALPGAALARQVLATPAIARQGRLGAARGAGIRFREGTPDAPKLLRELVDILSTMSSTQLFRKQAAGLVEKFMTLVDRGLRLDVAPDTSEFVLLRKAREEELISPSQGEFGPEPTKLRFMKQRARRTAEPRVSKWISFATRKLEDFFAAQLHGSALQNLLVGRLATSNVERKVQSPLAQTLRDIARSMKLKTDFVIEVVAPKSLGEKGVDYVEAEVQLTENGKPQKRSVFRIDPWFYSRPTEGGKLLTKQPKMLSYANKDGSGVVLFDARKGERKVMYKGQPTSVGDILAAEKYGVVPGLYVVTSVQSTKDYSEGNVVFEGFSTKGTFEMSQEKALKSRTMVPVTELTAKDVLGWQQGKGKTELPSVPQPAMSHAGKYAAEYGTGQTKLTTDPTQMGEFWADFSFAFGKMLVAHEWERLDAGEHDLLHNAFFREQNAARSLSPEAALARVVAHPVLERALGGRGQNAVAFTFEEWLVSNIARTMAQPVAKLGPVERFFERIGHVIRKALEVLAGRSDAVFALDPRKGRAHELVEQWVQRLTDRSSEEILDDSFLSLGTRMAALESIRKNQDALAGWNMEAVVATPQRAATAQVRKLLDHIPPDAVEDRKKLEALLAVTDRHNTILEWCLGIHQISDINPHIFGLKDYVTLTRAMENDAISWASMADKRLRQVQALPRAQQDGLWGLIVALDQLVYLDQDKLRKKEIAARWPTGEELLALVQEHKLSQEAFDAYKEIRSDFLFFLSYLEQVGVRNAELNVADPVLRAAKIAEVQGEIAQLRSRPYFPHTRFGKYAVTVRGNNRQVVHFETFDTEAQRTTAVPKIVERYNVPATGSMVEDEISPALQQYQGLPRFALQNILSALGLDGNDLSVEQAKSRDLLEAMSLASSPATSFRMRLVHRSNVPGFSADGMRAYANYFSRSARFVARMDYAERLLDSIREVRRMASPISKDSRTRIADYMQRHYTAQMQPAADWAELRSLAFMWYFAFVPSTAFVNLTQLPMVTGPYLAEKFGDLQTFAATTKAIGAGMKEFFSWARGQTLAEDSIKQEALDLAHDDRVIDDGFATELTAISNGSVLSRTVGGNKLSRGIRLVAQWGTAPFAMAERVNRSVTFRAAWDLAIKNPEHPHVVATMEKNKVEADRIRIDRGWDDTHIAAYLTAATAVRETQFEYSRWARPKLMEGKRGIILMFKSYVQNMIYFMFKQNRGTQARFMLGMLGMAGMLGLPGAEDMEEIVKWLSRQLGYGVDPKLFFRKMVKEHLHSDMADVLLHGASREGFGIPAALNGLGIPAPTIDLSGSLSLGRLIPGLAAGLNPNSASFNEVVGDLTREAAGPVVGVPFALYQSLLDHSLPADDVKRWERVMPRALRDISKSSRYLAEGRERDRGGATIVDFDPNDMSDQMEALATGLGFQSTRLTRQWDFIAANKEVEMYYTGSRTMLVKELFRAVRLKDADGKADALDAIRRFNKEVPYPAMKVTRDTLDRSLKARKRELQLREHDIPSQKMLRPLRKEMEGLYPEVESKRVK